MSSTQQHQVQDLDTRIWSRTKQITWIHANYRPKYWLLWAASGSKGWMTGTPAVQEIQSGRARLLHL